MEEQTVYIVDDDARELRANRRDLQTIFEGSPLQFKGVQPLRELADYNEFLPKSDTAAFLIDQRLQVSGEVNYSGIELASHLRSIASKLPIYILTNYETDLDLEGANEQTVEDIIGKDDLTHPNEPKAITFKARFLRRLQGFRDVLTAREQRFHDLLKKSLQENLSADDAQELEDLQSARLLPVHSAELKEIAAMENTIQELTKLLKKSTKQSKRRSGASKKK
jgi:CheY-like chemotaxis protein